MTRLTVATRSLLVGLLASVTLVAAPAVAAPPAGDFSYDNPRYDDSATLAVEGTLVAIADTVRGSEVLAYSVRISSGHLVAVPRSFGDDAPAGGHFEGELALTSKAAADLRAEGVSVTRDTVIDADTRAGEAALAVIAEQSQPAPVASATVTDPVEAAATPKPHHAYVAVITNLGPLPTDSAIESDLNAITSFWDDEAGAAIAGFARSPVVKYASSAANPSTCGLQSKNWLDVWNEAQAKFPGIAFGRSTTNHLVVLVPESCNPNGSVGIGSVGLGIGEGGWSIVKLGNGALQTGAHELGHNMGLGHANLEACSTSCSVAPYYNIYSVMGFSVGGPPRFTPPALDTASRRFLGLADEVANVTAPGMSTFELKPRTNTSGIRGLRILDPITQAEYLVDYRYGSGRDVSAFFASSKPLDSYRYGPGIVITQYLPAEPTGQATKVLTRKDGTLYRAALGANDYYANSTGGVQLTVNALGATGAGVTVVRPTAAVAFDNPTFSNLPRVLQPVSAVVTGWQPGTTFTYQWKINGAAIAGATSPTYKPTIADYSKNLSVTVKGYRKGFLNQTHTSVNTTQTKVYAGILGAGTPTISGTAKVGSTLKVNPGAWTYGTKLTYRWYANNAPISGATKTTYKITSNRRGAVITVKVTGSRYPFLAATKTSLPTAKVR